MTPFLCPTAVKDEERSRATSGSMSGTNVRGAAGRLKLASGVGGLGDVTREVDVPQTFDHNLLTPALREVSRRLRADEFKGDDASVARWLRGWIQHL